MHGDAFHSNPFFRTFFSVNDKHCCNRFWPKRLGSNFIQFEERKIFMENHLMTNILKVVIHIRGGFFNWPPLKKLKYVKPRLGVSTLTQIVLDTPNVAQINFFVLGTFRGGTSEEKKHPVYWHKCACLGCDGRTEM